MNVQRVALLSPYALSVYGGVQEQVLAMSRTLEASGVKVLVVAPDQDDHALYDTPAKVLRLGRRLSLPANGSRAPLTLSPSATTRASAALAAFRPDVVHVHEPFAPLLSYATLVRHRWPAVGTFHRGGLGPAVTYTKPLLRYFASKLDVAVAVSEAAAATLREGSGLVAEVLFNGVEMERFVESARQRPDEVTLLFVGRLEDRKGAAVALDAVLAHNRVAATPWRLIVAGVGPERERLVARAKGDDAIVFVGAISDAEKRAWLRRVHALVTPSTHGESFGLVLLEGMASETVVVASDIEGYREAAGGHATLVRPGDAADLARAIEAALSRESAALLDGARDYAARWSMAALMARYGELYERARQRFSVSR